MLNIGIAILVFLILGSFLVFVKYKEDKEKDKEDLREFKRQKGVAIFISSIRNVYYVLTGWAIALSLIEYINVFGVFQNSEFKPVNIQLFSHANILSQTFILAAFLFTIFRFVIGNSGALEKRKTGLYNQDEYNWSEMFIVLWDAGWCILVGCMFFFMAITIKYWNLFLMFFFLMFIIDSIWILGDMVYGIVIKGEALLKKCVCKQWIISNFINMAVLLILFYKFLPDLFGSGIIVGLCFFSFLYDFFWPQNVEHYLD